MGILRWFIKSPTGRVAGLAFIAVCVAGVLQFVYVELPKQEESAERDSGVEALERAADTLETLKTPPESTDWFPENFACGRTVVLENVPEAWKSLGFKDGDKTPFQFRLDTDENGYTLYARLDSDCDGIFATHRIEGSSDWTSTFSRRSDVQNLKE